MILKGDWDFIYMSGINLLVRLVISAGLLIVVLGQTGINANAAHSAESFSICTSPIKVMPLGDSITAGKYSGHDTDESVPEDDVGYRKDLWDLLTGAGYIVDFVGSQENGMTFPFSDPQHEGHNGWRDDQIADYIYNNSAEADANWLSQNPPDVILLHIGTNSIDADPSDVEDILDEIDEYESDTGRTVTVFVARIIDTVPSNTLVTPFNNNVEAMVQGRADYGAELFMVYMQNGAGIIYENYSNDPPGDMLEDGIHPYATGYTKMANAWMTAFDDICAHRPTLNNLFDRFSIEGSGAGVKIYATDPDDDPLTFSAQGLPAGLIINTSSGWITGSTQEGATVSSPYEVTVRVQDEGGLADQGTFNWYVDTTGKIYLPIAIR
ncbi:putative Ig domain-containing protein [Chloroflexota bacterium]